MIRAASKGEWALSCAGAGFCAKAKAHIDPAIESASVTSQRIAFLKRSGWRRHLDQLTSGEQRCKCNSMATNFAGLPLDYSTFFAVAWRRWRSELCTQSEAKDSFLAARECTSCHRIRLDFPAEHMEKALAGLGQPLLEPLGTIAGTAGPRFTPIFIPAAATIVGVLYAGEVEIFLPVGPLFQ
ncbi:MAG: hypothetical protein DMG30_06915 [Acidobacteria bacterium]|nr:MAG: hypothetical protein DMG30_06915 [Acidobacteriota bacterium]